MGMAVLRPQDCRFRDRRNPNPKGKRCRRRNPNSVRLQDKENEIDRNVVLKFPSKNLVVGQVKILKRGEKLKVEEDGQDVILCSASPLDSEPVKMDEDSRDLVLCSTDRLSPEALKVEKEERDLILCSTDRLGPEPVMVQEQIKVYDLRVVDSRYAGSAVVSSPPPSSLPIPAFFVKKNDSEGNDSAGTILIRQLLRLDLL